MYSAIVLDAASVAKLTDIFPGGYSGWKRHMHHVTLQMGAGDYPWGERREMKVTHIGALNGVVAMKVECPESKNKHPHVTLFTMDGVKPVKSNEIEDWGALDFPFTITGNVTLLP